METKYAKMNSHMKKVCRKYNTTGEKHIGKRHWLIDARHELAHCLRSKHGSTGWVKIFNSLLPIDEREGKRARIVNKYIQWFPINKHKTNSTKLFPDPITISLEGWKPKKKIFGTSSSKTILAILYHYKRQSQN